MKTHWFTSPDPPRFGENLVALCGEVVPQAQPVPALWDNEHEFGLVSCRRCDEELCGYERYTAVIEAGQQAMNEQRGVPPVEKKA